MSSTSSGLAFREALEEGVYLAKPNLRELKELTGEPLDELSARVRACRAVVESGNCEIVALTLAEQGAVAVTARGAWRAAAPTMHPVSTVGAGDSFLAAMVWRLAAGDDPDQALRYAVAAGSAALLAPGTALCHPSDVERLLFQVSIETLAF